MTSPRTQREVGELEWRIEREKANAVRCPRCLAAVGESCWNTELGTDLRAPAHPQRITVVRKGEREDDHADGS
jgi:hypothetical protein